MARKKEPKLADFIADSPIKEQEVIIVKDKPQISKLEFNFGNGDLNVLRDKVNEIIDSL